MEKEILCNLVLNHYKFDLLSEHVKNLTESDVFYEDIQLNDPNILFDVFKIIGFPFVGERVNENYKELFEYLKENYFDNVYSIDHKNIIDLKDKVTAYTNWLLEQKLKFDTGSIDFFS